MTLRYCSSCNLVMPANQYAKHRRSHPHRSGSTTAWRRLREQVLDRDHHRCQFSGCGATEQLEIHHLDGNWRHNDPSNLSTRCLAHNPRGLGGMAA